MSINSVDLEKSHCIFPYGASKKKKNQKHTYTKRIKLIRISIHQSIGISESRNINGSFPEMYNQTTQNGVLSLFEFQETLLLWKYEAKCFYLLQQMISVRASLKD